MTQKLKDSDDADAVHDVRVLSRRLQQGLGALFPKPRPGKIRTLRRRLRRVRRLLGDWRNCDVLIALAQRRLARARSAGKRHAWKAVLDHLQRKRSAHIDAARRQLSRLSFKDPGGLLKELTESDPAHPRHEALARFLRAQVDSAWTEWESALAHARTTRAATDIHRFRIAGKTLRYRLELLAEFGEKNAKPSLRFLKKLQSELGAWHDRQALFEAAAEAIARPEMLLGDLETARILLKEIDAGRQRQKENALKIFALADQRPATDQKTPEGRGEPIVNPST